MNSRDILNQIDDALEDWTVSDDAMRSRPTPDSPPIVATSGQVWVAPAGTQPDEDSWEQLVGVSSVELATLDQSTVDPNAGSTVQSNGYPLAAFLQRFEEAGAQHVDVVLRSLGHALEQIAQHSGADSFQHLPEADGCNNCSDPTVPPQRPRPPLPRRDGRPAWQTPYGPARRRP